MKHTPKNLQTLYLYADGHAVGVFEEHHQKSGKRIQYVEVWEKFGGRRDFTGRLILHHPQWEQAWFGLFEASTRIACQDLDVKHGSKRTRELNIAVGEIELTLPFGKLCIPTCSVLGGNFTYQPTGSIFGDEATTEPFNPDIKEWGDMRVAKIHRTQKVEVLA